MKTQRLLSLFAIVLVAFTLTNCAPYVGVRADYGPGPRYGYYGPRPYYRPVPPVIVTPPPVAVRPYRYYAPRPRYYSYRNPYRNNRSGRPYYRRW